MSAAPTETHRVERPLWARHASHASFRAKRALVAGALATLGTATEQVSRHSAEVRRELEGLREGWSFALSVLPRGPAMTLRHEQGRLRYVGGGERDVDVRVSFKSVDAALLVLTGQLAPHTSMAEKRAIVHGPLDEGMIVNRLMAVVAKLLYPTFLLAKLTKRMPVRSRADRLLTARLYATLGPALLTRRRG